MKQIHSELRVGARERKDVAVITVCVCTRLVISNSSATPWTAAGQVHLSMGFPRQEYWSGLPFPPPADLPDPGN